MNGDKRRRVIAGNWKMYKNQRETRAFFTKFKRLVAGVMDLRAMVIVTAAITAERLAPAGERVARVIGAVVNAAGLLLIVRATGLG